MGLLSAGAPHTGKPRFERVAKTFLVVCLMLAAGCYEVDQEVILASEAIAIPGLPGTYEDRDDPTKSTVVSNVPDSNDYRFKSGSDSGYLRAVPLRDDIYIVQVKYDDDRVYYLLFCRYAAGPGGGFQFLEVAASPEQIDVLAREHGVQIDTDAVMMVDTVDGPRDAILSFMRAHPDSFLTPG